MQPHSPLLALLSYVLAVTSAATPHVARQDAADITISGPFSLGINCLAVYNWTGGTPPFSASFSNIDTPSNPVPFVSWSHLARRRLEWTPQANATAQLLELTVQDRRGIEGSFGFIVVSAEEEC